MLIGRFAAVLDACVLHPSFLRHSLLWLARERLYRPLWSERILEEWYKSLQRKQPELSLAGLTRQREHFDKFPDAMVQPGEMTLAGLKLPDPNDGHVIVTGVLAHADAIITANLKHFPPVELAKAGLEAIHPDTFLVNLIDLDDARAVGALRQQREMMSRTNPTVEEFLDRFKKCGLPQAHTRLKDLRKLL